jgi:PadR family transcriptional regulator PadR
MTTSSLGEFELTILLSVARLGDDAYGLRVRREISALREREISVGATYTALQRLEEKGLVESWTTEPLPVRGGRSRRHFRVTNAGRKALALARERSARLWTAFDMNLKST